jgi:hypothetical protein
MVNSYTASALIGAGKKNREKIVLTLLDHGADIYQRYKV